MLEFVSAEIVVQICDHIGRHHFCWIITDGKGICGQDRSPSNLAVFQFKRTKGWTLKISTIFTHILWNSFPSCCFSFNFFFFYNLWLSFTIYCQTIPWFDKHGSDWNSYLWHCNLLMVLKDIFSNGLAVRCGLLAESRSSINIELISQKMSFFAEIEKKKFLPHDKLGTGIWPDYFKLVYLARSADHYLLYTVKSL